MARGMSPTSSQGQRGGRFLSTLSFSCHGTRKCRRSTRSSETADARHAVRKKPEEYDPFAGGLLPGSRPAPRYPPLSLTLSQSQPLTAAKKKKTPSRLPRFPDLIMHLAKVDLFPVQPRFKYSSFLTKFSMAKILALKWNYAIFNLSVNSIKAEKISGLVVWPGA